jgi:SulP family sulfate permease
MDYLRRYTEVIRTILVPPAVFIIRFCGILELEEYDLYSLNEITRRLQKSDIAVIFSDVGKNVCHQLKEFEIGQKLGDSNICDNIDESIRRANKLLQRHNVK